MEIEKGTFYLISIPLLSISIPAIDHILLFIVIHHQLGPIQIP